MTEKSILLYPHEVRGVLQGRQTRITRIIRPQPEGSFAWTASSVKECRDSAHYICPYEIGMRLWVRETWAVYNDTIYYRADNRIEGPWRSSIHMPRWASRLTLEVVGVRVERVRDISTEDIRAEGVDDGKTNPLMGKRHDASMLMAWESLWSSIHGPSSWAANPFCWVYNIKRVEER